jgi:hypothetical protein
MAMVSTGHFFWDALSSSNANSHVQTDEPPQYSLKAVKARREAGTRSSWFVLPKKTTYFLSTWRSFHLYLIVSGVVRVVRMGFCCSTEVVDSVEAALCSEALNEDALIRSREWILLSKQQRKRKNQYMPSERSRGNERGQNDCCDTLGFPQ